MNMVHNKNKNIKFAEKEHYFIKSLLNPKIKRWKHAEFQCKQCSYKTRYGISMKRHVIRKHQNLKSEEYHKCDYCDQ